MNNYTISVADADIKQLHSNHMGIEKTRLLACESMHWVNMNADIENAVKHCPTCL